MEDFFKTLNLFDYNKIFRGYATMIELYNALKCITMLFFIQYMLRLNLGVAFLKSVSIYFISRENETNIYLEQPFLFAHKDQEV